MIKINSSYKYSIFFLALIALISFCETSNSATDEIRAGVCSAPITNTGTDWEWCSTQPTTQILTFYKVAFCPALPTIPTGTTAIDITNCSTVFENTAGATVSIQKGVGAIPAGTFEDPGIANIQLTGDFITSSSIILITPVFNQFDLIYAGAQKNMGAAGVNMVVVRKNILGKITRPIPTIMNYQKRKWNSVG